jgi:GAF domain-containing protein
VEPIPETKALFEELAASGDPELPAALLEVARRIEEAVPDCVGLSLAVLDEGITMTLVATDRLAAHLDATQYLDGGPCVDAVDEVKPVNAVIDDLLDEGRWLLYAQLGAASGVASSLSLPVTVNGEIVGGVNIYASTPTAFEGRREQIAEVLGTHAEWAVANADLSFSSRLRAVESPERFASQRAVDVALGMIAARHGVTIAEAHERLRRAAAQAGITEAEAARAVTHLDIQDN